MCSSLGTQPLELVAWMRLLPPTRMLTVSSTSATPASLHQGLFLSCTFTHDLTFVYPPLPMPCLPCLLSCLFGMFSMITSWDPGNLLQEWLRPIATKIPRGSFGSAGRLLPKAWMSWNRPLSSMSEEGKRRCLGWCIVCQAIRYFTGKTTVLFLLDM